MKTSEQINELAAALSKAQGEMQNATLNKTNPHFRSQYADLAAIRDATIPVLSRHGLAIIQVVGLDDNAPVVFTRLLHASGQWIEGDYPLPVSPMKPQEMGSAVTYAKRYSWAAMCGIAAEEDDDANTANASGATTQARPKQAAPSDKFKRAEMKPQDEDPLKAIAKEWGAKIETAKAEDVLDEIQGHPDLEDIKAALPTWYARLMEKIKSRRAQLDGSVLMAG